MTSTTLNIIESGLCAIRRAIHTMVSRTLYLSQAYTEYQSKRAQNPSNLAHDLPSTANDRFFALPELCE
jgi:hypothetical protein